jgi:hypothetical protein
MLAYIYVDNVFAIWPHGSATLKDFIGHLNSRHPNIMFSMELERDRQLSFLDVLVNQCPDNSLGYVVYREATHIDRYLQAASHHKSAHKMSVITTLMDGVKKVCDETNQALKILHVNLIL